MAPEILAIQEKEDVNYTDKVDIWALGVIGYEMMGNIVNVNDLKFCHSEIEKTAFSNLLKEMVMKMLKVDPFERATAEELLNLDAMK